MNKTIHTQNFSNIYTYIYIYTSTYTIHPIQVYYMYTVKIWLKRHIKGEIARLYVGKLVIEIKFYKLNFKYSIQIIKLQENGNKSELLYFE